MGFLGFLVGWIVGSQQGRTAAPAAPGAAQTQAAAETQAPKLLDQAAVQALRNTIDRDPGNATARVQLANLYYDSEMWNDAIKWYEEALAIDPKKPDVSTDLGVCYYNLNQPDRALEEFQRSLSVDPRHTRTMFNIGIVRAFGKQDLKGAADMWMKLIAIAPDSVDGQNAKRALDGLKSAHPEIGGGSATGSNPGSGG